MLLKEELARRLCGIARDYPGFDQVLVGEQTIRACREEILERDATMGIHSCHTGRVFAYGKPLIWLGSLEFRIRRSILDALDGVSSIVETEDGSYIIVHADIMETIHEAKLLLSQVEEKSFV